MPTRNQSAANTNKTPPFSKNIISAGVSLLYMKRCSLHDTVGSDYKRQHQLEYLYSNWRQDERSSCSALSGQS